MEILRKARGAMTRIRLKIKEVATSRGWNQAKLGRAADLNPRTMQEIWHDPYRNVTYATLVKIARVLGVEVSELTEEEPDA